MDATQGCDLTGTAVARYAVVELIGSGGMGHVYRAWDERLQRDVAIKILARPVGASARRGSDLAAEARALSRLSHPHVAAIYDFLTHEGRDFIVMELITGVTLREMLTNGPLPFAEVIRLGKQMVQGLGAAHDARILHCDIKPANLKITASGNLKILDFGLAKSIPGPTILDLLTVTICEAGPIGTMPYMSPEQLKGETVDERSDIFSVGAVLFEMATGTPAFPQGNVVRLTEAILHEDPLAPSTLNPRVPPRFDRCVSRALAKRPAQRYRTVAELGEALEKVTASRRLRLYSKLPRWLVELLDRPAKNPDQACLFKKDVRGLCD